MSTTAIWGWAILYGFGWLIGGFVLMQICEDDWSARRSRGHRDYTAAEAGGMVLLSGWFWPIALIVSILYGICWLIGKALGR